MQQQLLKAAHLKTTRMLLHLDAREAVNGLKRVHKQANSLKNLTRKVTYKFDPANPLSKGTAVGSQLAAGIAAGITAGQPGINQAAVKQQ